MISFVFYFHSSRTNNLKQTLRFLFSREKIEKEVILICNDQTSEVFSECTLINLNLTDYEKSKMCNIGVNLAKYDIVALLDSDRILPNNYFTDNIPKMNKREFASCLKMLNLKKDYNDEEIDSFNFNFKEEFRSFNWEIRKKNLFSGNTLFYKSDYLNAGGMDESFTGYGFADNDMSKNVVSKGFEIRWTYAEEIHLFHPKKIMKNNQLIDHTEYEKIVCGNMNKFIKKWKIREYLNKYKLY